MSVNVCKRRRIYEISLPIEEVENDCRYAKHMYASASGVINWALRVFATSRLVSRDSEKERESVKFCNSGAIGIMKHNGRSGVDDLLPSYPAACSYKRGEN